MDNFKEHPGGIIADQLRSRTESKNTDSTSTKQHKQKIYDQIIHKGEIEAIKKMTNKFINKD